MSEETEPQGGVQADKVPERVMDGMPTMYGFQTCPFCWKVRALLRAKGVAFTEVEVDPMKKKEVAWSDWKVVPVYVEADGTQVNDSNDILHWINENHTGGMQFPTQGQDADQDAWMAFSNDVLGKSIVAVIYRSYKSSRQALRYVTTVDKFSRFSAWQSIWIGGFVMKMVGKSRAKMFDLAPEDNFTHQLDVMSAGFKGDFFGGDGPNGADFANFGILRSMQGLRGYDLLEAHPVVQPWYGRMQTLSES
jgi:microsomal prostaglandin-E synthase 2